MHIKLSENFRAVFYAPFYATHALGFYTNEGVEVELLDSPAPAAAAAGLLDGSIDIAWGGPMRVMKARDDDPAFSAGLLLRGRRARSVLSRRQGRSFEISACRSNAAEGRDRVGGRPRPGSVSNTICACEASIRRASIAWLSGRCRTIWRRCAEVNSMWCKCSSHTCRWRCGAGTATFSMQPARADRRCYTTFLASRDSIRRNRAAFEAMVRATRRTLTWVAEHSAEELADAVAPYYADVPREILINLVSSATGMRDFGRSRPMCRGRDSRGLPIA